MGAILGLHKPKVAALVVGLLILGAATTGGIALAGGFSAQPAPSPQPATATLPQELSTHFAALSDAPTADVSTFASADAESKSRIEASAGGTIASQYGLSASLAREVTYGKTHVWLIPGATGISLDDLETGTGAGGPIAHALAGTLITDVGGNENGITGGGTVYGIAPNGNSKVVVHDADGSTEDVPVEHNVYVITRPGSVSVEVADGAGKVQTVAVPG
ncbi:MAG TPA: hypothetical protein VGI76_07235 [Solirubrobacteraceae bacterium]